MSRQAPFGLHYRRQPHMDAPRAPPSEHVRELPAVVPAPVRANLKLAGRHLERVEWAPLGSPWQELITRLPPSPRIDSRPCELIEHAVDRDAWVHPLDPHFSSLQMLGHRRATSASAASLQRPLKLTVTTATHTKATHTNKTTTKTAHRRAQCRANQARYRERQRQKKADTEEETACLREIVGLLEIQRTLMRATQNPDFEYVHHAVTSFFRQFRRGVAGANDDDVAMSELLSPDRASARAPAWTKVGRAGRNVSLLRQIAFVRCVVSEDAEFGGGGGVELTRGPNALLEQCWRYSALHSNPWVQLLTIHRSSSSSHGVEHVVATAQLTVGITEQTLAVVFPGVRRRLGKKLLGKRVEYSVQFDLEFARAGVGELLQLVWATTRMDVVGSLLKVLSDPSEVEEVVRCARISMHGYIGGW